MSDGVLLGLILTWLPCLVTRLVPSVLRLSYSDSMCLVEAW